MLGGEHLSRRRRRPRVEDGAASVAHALHRERLREPALRAERGVRVREVEQAHLATADGEPEAVALGVGEPRQAEAVRDLEQRLGPAERVERAHRGDVERGRERDAQRDEPVEGAVVVERDVRTVGAGEARRDVEERGRGREAVLERGRVEERLERRAGRAQRERHVDVAAVRGIAVGRAADHREDAAGPRLERDERGVGRVPVAQLGEVRAHEPLGLVL